jgi:choline dehydrogenase-like flavoprotein
VNPDSGWPIAKSDLDGYAAETDDILDLEPNDPATSGKQKFKPLEPISFRFSPPTRFRTKYRDELARSTLIRMYLNANLVEIGLDEARRNVTELRFKSFTRDGSFAVKANQFVFCLGGIENARFLLNSELGNRYDLVGRYFCEHLIFTVGDLLLKTRRRIPKFLGPTPEFLSRAGTLNFGLRVKRLPQSAKSYLDLLRCSTTVQSIGGWIGKDLGCDRPGRLRIASEQALNPNSRVQLVDRVDRFGLRQVALNWQISEIDRHTIRIAAVECGKIFATEDIGRARPLPWILDQAMDLPSIDQDDVIGMHHMCTTRMSSDPRKGVVDANCRVHDVANLYLAGSSVFATSGHSNPTYTIIQLALRLPTHIEFYLRKRLLRHQAEV